MPPKTSITTDHILARLKELDAQQKTTIVLLGDLRREIADLSVQLDNKTNIISRQLLRSFEKLLTGDNPAETTIKDFLFQKGTTNKPTPK